MPFTPRYDFITPFADEAMRLRRETWANPTMLSEELWAIFQQKIPQPKTPPIIIQLNTDSKDFIQFRDKYGGTIGAIDNQLRLTRRTTVQPRETPTIVWADPADIIDGAALSATELNAVAVDPIALTELAGTYEYDPPSGTVLSLGLAQPLLVVFTPTNTASYKRARKTAHINVVPMGGGTFGILDWTPGDIWADGTLGGAQLNAIARDANTSAVIVGSYVYTPASGATLAAPAGGQGSLHCDFTPSSPADLATYGIVSGDADIRVLGIFAVNRLAQNQATTSGDLIVVGVEVGAGASGSSATVTDTQGNTYLQAGGYVEVGSGAAWSSVSLWYAFTSTTGANAITITPAGSGASVASAKYLLYTGAISFDGTSNSSGPGTGETLSAGTTPITGNRELIVFMATSNVDSVSFVNPWNTSNRDNAKMSQATNWGVAPNSGANAALDIAGGSAIGVWAIITASFKHRIS